HSARQDRRHPGAHRALADDELALAADERRVPDEYAADVGDGVERTRRAVERNAKVARARLRGLIRRLGGREDDAEQQPGHGEGEFVDHEGRGTGGSGGVMPALTLPAPGQVMQPLPRGAPETAGGPQLRRGSQGCDRSVTFGPAPEG